MPVPYPISSSVADQIKHVNEEFVNAFNAGDAHRLAQQTYCKEGKALPAGMGIQQGTKAIAGLFQGVMDMGVKSVKLVSSELFAFDSNPSPESIFESGTWTFFDKDGKTMDHGKYIVIFVQEGGHYRYLYDMFSSNGPVSSA